MRQPLRLCACLFQNVLASLQVQRTIFKWTRMILKMCQPSWLHYKFREQSLNKSKWFWRCTSLSYFALASFKVSQLSFIDQSWSEQEWFWKCASLSNFALTSFKVSQTSLQVQKKIFEWIRMILKMCQPSRLHYKFREQSLNILKWFWKCTSLSDFALELISFKNEQKIFWNSRLNMIILWTTEIRRKLA